MNIVFLSWKDIHNPAAGGAELFHQEVSTRLVKLGHTVTHLVPGFANSKEFEIVDGVKIHRVGNSTLYFYWLPIVFFNKYRKDTDYLIDVFNCFGSFFNLFWFDHKKTIFLIHHIQDILWFHQTVFPGLPNWLVPIINFFGYFIEKVQLWFYALIFNGKVATVSNSTLNELAGYGFNRNKIEILSEGITDQPLASLEDSLPKEDNFTILTIGLRKMKQPEHVLKAFSIFWKENKNTKLWVVGWGSEGDKLKRLAEDLGIINNVVFYGRVSNEQRNNIMQKANILVTAPVKEGWGIIVIEANALGTPTLGYNVPGLRDALSYNNGWLCKPNINDLASEMSVVYNLWKTKPEEYYKIRQNGLDTLNYINFDKTTKQMLKLFSI
jgi:glycosyltransferase involved in cell wall biosynthesis